MGSVSYYCTIFQPMGDMSSILTNSFLIYKLGKTSMTSWCCYCLVMQLSNPPTLIFPFWNRVAFYSLMFKKTARCPVLVSLRLSPEFYPQFISLYLGNVCRNSWSCGSKHLKFQKRIPKSVPFSFSAL